jgi:hypothetical protein
LQAGCHTRIGNFDLDHAGLEGLPIEGKGLLEAVKIGKLNITEALGTLHLSVFNDSDTDDSAALEKLSDGLDGGVVRQVAKVGGVWRLVGQLWRAIVGFTNRVACRKKR